MRWRAIVLPLTMSSCWLMLILQPTASLTGCSAAWRSLVHHKRLSHRNGTVLWLFGALRGCLMSPLSWPRINTLLGRHAFYLLSRQPKGLLSYTAFPSAFTIREVGGPAPFPTFQTLLRRLMNPLVHDPQFWWVHHSLIGQFCGLW